MFLLVSSLLFPLSLKWFFVVRYFVFAVPICGANDAEFVHNGWSALGALASSSVRSLAIEFVRKKKEKRCKPTSSERRSTGHPLTVIDVIGCELPAFVGRPPAVEIV